MGERTPRPRGGGQGPHGGGFGSRGGGFPTRGGGGRIGFVILDGQYVSPPYPVAWTKEKGLTIADRPVRLAAAATQVAVGSRGDRGKPAVRLVTGTLKTGGLVLQSPDGPGRIVAWGPAFRVMTVLQSDRDAADKVEALSKLKVAQVTRDEWQALARTFRRNEGLAKRLAALQQLWPDVRTDEPVEPETSPLRTIVIMAASIGLSVLAFWVLLTRYPSRQGGWRGQDASAEALRSVLWCVGLLVVLNVVDLTFTLMASGSEVFEELNPVAAALVGTAPAMITFKVVLLTVGAGVLLALRKHRAAQLASWYVAMVYAVVMLRWATYNSLWLL